MHKTQVVMDCLKDTSVKSFVAGTLSALSGFTSLLSTSWLSLTGLQCLLSHRVFSPIAVKSMKQQLEVEILVHYLSDTLQLVRNE
jgi:hypothetical protein